MALEQKLIVGMRQKLVLTPSLQQAIKLLQMSTLEVAEEIQQELLENPVLEEVQLEPQADSQLEPEVEEQAPDPFEDIDCDAYFQNVDQDYLPRAVPERGVDLPSFENTLTKPQDLASHLTWQLDLSATTPAAKEIGRLIIGNLNDDGYLRASLEEIRQTTGYSMEQVEQTLRMIQEFDPVGVASRDLVECLCLQLRHLGQEGTPAETIVRYHLDKVQGRRYRELAEALQLDIEDLRAELEVITHLDPRPGQKYKVQVSTYVVPDVHVVKIGEDYQVLLNDDGLPRLRISPVYRQMAKKGDLGTSQEAREYVRGKLRSAFRLIKSLDERQRTIHKVATSIVRFQREFLDYGIERLRPLVLKDVAEDIGMHESTVSRVVNNKYMHTHRGLYEMRFFFHSGISSVHGAQDVSSLTVKDKIRKIIAHEDSRHPLSDATIVKMLRADGLDIARRTVAKYREEMKIPSSSRRKQVLPG
jgi:RNA polymerase sigma-54 factor